MRRRGGLGSRERTGGDQEYVAGSDGSGDPFFPKAGGYDEAFFDAWLYTEARPQDC